MGCSSFCLYFELLSSWNILQFCLLYPSTQGAERLRNAFNEQTLVEKKKRKQVT